jgi:hypothetical protein
LDLFVYSFVKNVIFFSSCNFGRRSGAGTGRMNAGTSNFLKTPYLLVYQLSIIVIIPCHKFRKRAKMVGQMIVSCLKAESYATSNMELHC